MNGAGNDYWEWPDNSWGKGRQQLWREHSDAVNGSLLSRWYRAKKTDTVLKTDLFDEMCSTGLFSMLTSQTMRAWGIDISHATVRAARSRHAMLEGITADVRCLPFEDDTFDLVISNSTLDHFEKYEAISKSLAEIFRVLHKDGQLILTMDNRMNPLIAVRNALPYLVLKRMHLTPYYVGATWGPGRLRNELIRAGFKIIEMDAVLHCPRVLAVAAAFMMGKFAPRRLQNFFLRILSCFELMRYLPTRFLTGHFVAVKANKGQITSS